MAIESTNPATGELLASFEALDAAAVDERLGRAAAAFLVWRRTSFAERARILNTAADLLEADQERLARLMTLEMGKLLRAARDEVLKSARGCRYYARHGAGFLADEEIATEASRSYVR